MHLRSRIHRDVDWELPAVLCVVVVFVSFLCLHHPVSTFVLSWCALKLVQARRSRAARRMVDFLRKVVKFLSGAIAKRDLSLLLDALEASSKMKFQPKIVDDARRLAKLLVCDGACRCALS